MAETHRTRPGAVSHRKPSRLQSRAPSSLKISRSVDWNVAIPLLSPLASSPPPAELKMASSREEPKQQEQRHQIAEPEKVVFKKWQHPAAPFCSEPASLVTLFVPV